MRIFILSVLMIAALCCEGQTSFTPISPNAFLGGDSGGCLDSKPVYAGPGNYRCSDGTPITSGANAQIKLTEKQLALLSDISKELKEIKTINKDTNEAIVKNINEFSTQLRAAINARFDDLKKEVANSPEMTKLRDDLLKMVDAKVNDLVDKNKEPGKQ